MNKNEYANPLEKRLFEEILKSQEIAYIVVSLIIPIILFTIFVIKIKQIKREVNHYKSTL